LVLAFLSLLLLSMSVLSCVDTVPLSDTMLFAHSEQLAFDTTMVHSLLQSWSCTTLK
jgi:hypothetical protein